MITLPAGVVPTVRAIGQSGILAGHTGRSVRYRFDLLDPSERLIGTLDGVQPGGSVQWSAASSIKGSGQISVLDLGQSVDWLNVRIRPVMLIDGLPDQPLGVWLCATPEEAWTDLGRSWDVTLIDKASVLDSAYVGESGAQAYAAPSGSNVIDLVKDLIVNAGESAASIAADDAVLSSGMVWDVGETTLKIVNDLLDAGGFFSLYSDFYGGFRADKYVLPADRPVSFEASGPFVYGPDSVMSPEWKRAQSVDVPNRFLAVGVGNEASAALTSVATNEDPSSPYSYQSRGRWITKTETGVEAASQDVLDAYAARSLISASQPGTSLSVQHLPLPGLRINSVVRVSNPRADLDSLVSVQNTKITLSFDALAESTLAEVLAL